MIKHKQQEIRYNLSPDEKRLMCHACYGIVWEPDRIWSLPDVIAAAIDSERLDREWNVDGKALVATLRAMDLLTLVTLAHGLERAWGKAGRRALMDHTYMVW